MKFVLLFALAAVGQAKRLDIEDQGEELVTIGEALRARGIDEKELITGNRWRNKWPEGVTDPSDGDDLVLNMEGFPKKKKAPDAPIRYEWTLDSDVLDTYKTIQDTEAKTGKKLAKDIW